MKAKAILWFQSYDMHEEKTIVSSLEKEVDFPLKAGGEEKLMRLAIESGDTLPKEFMKCVGVEYSENKLSLIEAIGDELHRSACRILIEFPMLPEHCYVFKNNINGKVKAMTLEEKTNIPEIK